MTKNITAALFAVFIFAAIPTPASANPGSGTGGGSSGLGESGPVYTYWDYLEERLAQHRARMRWLEDEDPAGMKRAYQLDDTNQQDKLTYWQTQYLKAWKETKRIHEIFLSRVSDHQMESK